jgi:hypothetical protein
MLPKIDCIGRMFDLKTKKSSLLLALLVTRITHYTFVFIHKLFRVLGSSIKEISISYRISSS